MAEIIYQYPSRTADNRESSSIRWLEHNDLHVFNAHLEACGQRPISDALWTSIWEEGTVYCGLFVDGHMVARACVEKYSERKWEVADVRTVNCFRNRGFAFQVSHFVLQYILSQHKEATIRTEADNLAMQKVIARLGFTQIP